ncbi:MAG: magnesium transporter [Fimbriimonadaceae bacterium]|nr:magnesium transporter [Fimbriimonadaceae bacterium]
MPEETAPSLEQLEDLVEDDRYAQAQAMVATAHPSDAADALQALEPDEIARILETQDKRHVADVLEELPDDIAAATLVRMSATDAAEVVTELLSDEEADILAEVPEEHREAIILALDEGQRTLARELLSYDEDSAGGLMQKEFVALSLRARAGEAIAGLQARADEIASYPAAYLYVVDGQGVLKGILNLRALLFSQPETSVLSIMTKNPVSVNVATPSQDLLKIFRRHRYLALPVVDDDGVLRGVVTKDDALQFESEEIEEEFLRFSGIAGGEEVRDMPTWLRTRRRLIWLAVKMALNVAVGGVIAHFSDTLREVIALAALLPIISDMGGSAGGQAIAVSIRELSLGRIKVEDALWVSAKELGVGLLNGLILGGLIAAGAFVWQHNLVLSGVVGVALLANTILAVCLGGVLPLVLQKLRVDPAAASGPFLTMTTDVCGFALVLWLAGRFVEYLK